MEDCGSEYTWLKNPVKCDGLSVGTVEEGDGDGKRVCEGKTMFTWFKTHSLCFSNGRFSDFWSSVGNELSNYFRSFLSVFVYNGVGQCAWSMRSLKHTLARRLRRSRARLDHIVTDRWRSDNLRRIARGPRGEAGHSEELSGCKD